MSSTLSRPRADTAAPAAEIPATTAQAVTGDDLNDEKDFRQFVKAIVIGVVIGLPLVMGLMVLLVQMAAPDMGLGPAVGIGLWVSIWTGMFLGGTVTVGLWSKHQHS